MQDLAEYFDQFIDNISLGEPQVTRLTRAADGIMTFVRDQYGLPASAVFLQGSYPNGTAVEPVEGGEYDVDIVAVCVGSRVSADAALDDLERRFRSNGNYANRITSKKPCVRLDYADDEVGSFHVDVVPVRQSGKNQPPLDAPRRGDGWHETAPAEYTQWCRSQGEEFARTVKVLKRWRDEQQSVRAAIKSIVLQVLVAHYMPTGLGSDQERVVHTFNRMHADLKDRTIPPVVYNPVLPTENLARNWSASDFANFLTELKEAFQLSQAAANVDERLEAIDKWRELLGEDFPADTPKALGLALSDYKHAQEPHEKGWRVSFDPRYQVTVSMYITRGRGGKLRKITNPNYVVFEGNRLKFVAHPTTPNHVEVWWQVVNTGKHARDRSSLRGEIARGRTRSGQPGANQNENWESTAYTGTHLVRAMLVRSNVVVATSKWRYVNIYAKRHPFQP